MALEQLRADYRALTGDLRAHHVRWPDTDRYDFSQSLLWHDMRDAIAHTRWAHLDQSRAARQSRTRFGEYLLRMLAETRDGEFNHDCDAIGCMQAEPAFMAALHPAPLSPVARQLWAPPVLLEGPGGIDGMIKFVGEKTMLSFVDGNTTAGGLYGFPDEIMEHMHDAIGAADGTVVVPTEQLWERLGPPLPIRLSNFALDAECRANIGELLYKDVLGSNELRQIAEQRAGEDYTAALRRGQQLLRALDNNSHR